MKTSPSYGNLVAQKIPCCSSPEKQKARHNCIRLFRCFSADYLPNPIPDYCPESLATLQMHCGHSRSDFCVCSLIKRKCLNEIMFTVKILLITFHTQKSITGHVTLCLRNLTSQSLSQMLCNSCTLLYFALLFTLLYCTLLLHTIYLPLGILLSHSLHLLEEERRNIMMHQIQTSEIQQCTRGHYAQHIYDDAPSSNSVHLKSEHV